MGQGGSTNRKKSFGSVLLGYKVATSVYTKHHHEETLDNVLFKPFLYGLDDDTLLKSPASSSSSSGSSSSSSSYNYGNNRTDSGFLLCEKDSQLWNDLIYVDQTYYSSCFFKSMRPSEPEDSLIGDVLTVDDIVTTTLLQDLDLSKKGLGVISPYIGLLPMIRKLDL